MTIQDKTCRDSYVGNGTTTQFTYNHKFFTPADLQVQLFDSSTADWVTPAPKLNGNGTFDYTITGTFDTTTGEYPGGTITFNNAPLSTYKIVISLNLGFTQELSLQDNSKYSAASLNDALDRVTLLTQQLKIGAGQYSIAAPLSDEPDSIDMTLPPQVERTGTGFGTLLGFDGNGNVMLYATTSQQAPGPPMQGLKPKIVTGAAHTYGPNDYGCLVLRSNGGSAMIDVMPQANAGGGLAASTTIAIRNDDTGGASLAVAAMPIGPGTPTTALEGQVPQRSDGNSLAFIEPGQAAIYAYDTVPALPTWRDTTRALSRLMTGDIATLQLVSLNASSGAASAAGATPGLFGGAATAPGSDYWPSRLVQTEAAMGPYNADFQNALYRIWGSSVAVGTASTWSGRTGSATYPRDSFPINNYSTGVQRLISGAGQVIERAATNLLPNPGMTGATVGTGVGDLPTNWRFVLSADANTTIAVGAAAYPDGTLGQNRIRVTITRTGSSVANASMALGMSASPGIQVPTIALGGVNFSAMCQVVSSSGVFSAAKILISETQSDGVTFVGTTVGDAIGANFNAGKSRCWRAVPHNNYADCQLQILLSNPTANFSVTLDILVTQLEDSGSIADYTTYTSGTRNAEGITLLIPTSGGMGRSDVFLQSATRGSWMRNNTAGNLVISALAGEGYGVLQRARAFAAGALDWLRSTQAASFLEPASTPSLLSANWFEIASTSIVQLGALNTGFAYWQATSADSPLGTASWAANAALNKQKSQIARLELRKGDVVSGTEQTRIDAWDPLNAVNATLPLYQDNWLGFSFYLEPGTPLSGFANNANWLRLHELASIAANGFSLALELTPAAVPGGDGEHLALQLRGSGITVNGVNNPATYYPYTTPAAISRGVWHDIVYKVHLDEHVAGSGALALYLDGVLLYSYSGPLGYAADTPFPRMEIARPNPGNLPHETLAVQFGNIAILSSGTLTARANGTLPDVA